MNVLREARYAESWRTHAEAAGKAGDIILIALGWMIFIVAILYPITQILGILACSVAFLFSGGRTSATPSVEI